jgi:predicted phage replisome organizer/uncharacterized phage protein (TIGR02220 family)
MGKRYYWLKLFEDFFTSKRIKKLRSIAGGDTFTIIYLKMQLKALKTEGYLYYDGFLEDFAEELALDLDEDPDNVRVTIKYLLSVGLLETNDGEAYKLPYLELCTGSESDSTERVRRHRERQAQLAPPKPEPKTNAERQNAHRAKKACEEAGHVPLTDDATNKKRYGGNYYVCLRRDGFQCAICGSKENLCLHHIDGYFEDKPENNAANKMVTLCRKCHSNVHAGRAIPQEVLETIEYSTVRNESNEVCNVTVTTSERNGNVEKEIEKEIETDKEKEYIAEQTRHDVSGHPGDSLRTKKDNVQQEKRDGLAETSRQIIAHLNEVAGTAYKSNSKATLRHISARLNEGYLLEEFYAVIDKKWREWGGSDMEKYMRPETLFGSKFEGYLNEPETQKKKKGGTQQTSGPVDWDAYV